MDWLNEFVSEIETKLDQGDQKSLAMKQVTLNELTSQPYAGQFLFYQLFEESSTADETLIKKAKKNCTEFDYIQYLNFEEIIDPEEYFDMNKQLQLREKLP